MKRRSGKKGAKRTAQNESGKRSPRRENNGRGSVLGARRPKQVNRGVSLERFEAEPEKRPISNQSGDLTGVPGRVFSAGESVTELMREGQGLEGELTEAVENAPDADQQRVPVHRGSRAKMPDYKNRNRL
jgi:hypothetical protein